MKKSLILFLLILISVCAVSNVSAADDANILASDNTTDIETKTTDESPTEDYLADSQDNANNLKSGNNNYRDLQYKIDNAKEGDTITIEGNYTCDYLINVDKTLKIVGAGDGAVIKYNGSSEYNTPFFNIGENASNVVLSNIKFVGSVFLYGGAITWQGDYGTLKDCEFIDNNARSTDYGIGGALLIIGKNCKVDGCTFINNHAVLYGGAIISNGTGTIISDCEFSDNVASGEGSYGGALVLRSADSTVRNCIFSNNHCIDYGGAIAALEENIAIINCQFINNYVSNKNDESKYTGGGAIFSANSHGLTVDDCDFIGNHAREAYGGAISLCENDTVKKSFFEGNYASLGNDLILYDCKNIISNHFVIDYNETPRDAIFIYSDEISSKNTFEKIKVDSNVIFSPGLIFEYGDAGHVGVSVDGGIIELKNIKVLNHNEAKITYTNNEITISNLNVGNYVLRVTTTPDENHTAVDGYMNFTVKKATAVISASKLTVALKSSSVWKITLIDARNKKPISGMKLNLKVYTGSKYKTVQVTTNAKGIASYKTNALTAGTHKIIVSGKHNGYNFNTLTSQIAVVKQTPLTFKLQSKESNKKGSGLSYIVYNKNTKKAINGVKLKVLIYTGKKYKEYTLTTKKIKGKKTYNGAIGFTTNDFSAGAHKVIIKPVALKYKGSITTSLTIQKAATKGIKYFRTI